MAVHQSSKGQLVEIRRHRTKRTQNPQISFKDSWIVKNWLNIVFAGVLAVGLVLLLNPFDTLAQAVSASSAQMQRLIQFLAYDQVALIIGLIAIVVGSVGLGTNIITQVKYDPRFGNSACPDCQHMELYRSPRKSRDHFLNRLGIPVRRYICRECFWAGARVDRSRL